MKKIFKIILVLGMIIAQFYILDPSFFKNKSVDGSIPVAKDGKIDLSKWDFFKNGAVKLNGEWEFYDNKILTPKDFENLSNKRDDFTGYVKITSTRKGKFNGKSIAAKGTGTYRLIIKIKPLDEVFGIKIGNVRMSNRLYIDGKDKGHSGNPAEKEKGYVSRNTPYSAYFKNSRDEIEIILQTANFEYPFGGVHYKIDFGLQKDINFMTMATTAAELTGFIVVVLFGIYHLNVYFIRKKDKSFLYTGIFFLIFSVIFITTGERIILLVFPNIPSVLIYKIQQVFNTLMIIPLSGIINNLDSKIFSKKVIKAFSIASIPYIIISVLTSPSVHFYLNIIIFSLNLLFVILIILRLMIMYLKNTYGFLEKKGTLLLLKSMICLSICLGNNYLYTFSLLHSNTLGSIAFFGFIIFTANTLAYRFALVYENIEKMSQELIKMDKVKDEFITKTSYELKAPLYGIINIIETIVVENSYYLKEKATKDIIIIKDIAVRLSNIINDVLDVTLLKNEQLKIHTSIVDMKVCINIVIESAKYIMKNKNIEIINNINESIMARADENRVMQVLFNLINNSVESMNAGIITIDGNVSNNMAYISIEDTGSGIPEEKQRDIFKLYESFSTKNISLGLYIARQLIELMGGEIYLEWSEIGKGSRFIFSIPTSKEKLSSYSAEKIEEMKYFQSLVSVDYFDMEVRKAHENTILIVDDEIFNIQAALNILNREEYNILIAMSGEEALRKIQENEIDLVLLDVMMPKISGIDICRRIREKYSVIELPILISIVGNSNSSLFLGLEAGANDFIAKPFEGKEVSSRVRTLIKLKKSMEDAIKNELAFLQAQIKPHFLYNAISTIIYFCHTDGKKAAELLTDFSKYLRLTFDIDNNLMIIPLSRELEVIDAYVQIQKARFGEKIKIEYDIDEDIMDDEIPSLFIQPLVENSIKHGIRKKEEGGTVYVSVKNQEDAIYIVVRDTGVGMSAEKVNNLKNIEHKDKGVGFLNISRRIRRLNKAELDIVSIEGEGTTVTIVLKDL